MNTYSATPWHDSPVWYIQMLGGLRIERVNDRPLASLASDTVVEGADANLPSRRSDADTSASPVSGVGGGGVFPTGIAVHSRPKALALLALLALKPGVHYLRTDLIAELWPAQEPDSRNEALLQQYLRSAISALRQVLEPESRNTTRGGAAGGRVLVTDRHRIWLAADAIVTDVEEFERGLRRKAAQHGAHQAIRRSVDLYRTSGGLLPSFNGESVDQERRRLERLYLQALPLVVQDLERSGDLLTALVYVSILLHAVPEDEEALATLLRIETALGAPERTTVAAKERRMATGGARGPNRRHLAKSRTPAREPGDIPPEAIPEDTFRHSISRIPAAARSLLPMLSLFGGSFTGPAAAAIANIAPAHAERLLQLIVDARLIHQDSETMRFRVPDSLRWFIACRLKERRRREGNMRLGQWLHAWVMTVNREARDNSLENAPQNPVHLDSTDSEQSSRPANLAGTVRRGNSERQFRDELRTIESVVEAHLSGEADDDSRHSFHRAAKLTLAARGVIRKYATPASELVWFERILNHFQESKSEDRLPSAIYVSVLVQGASAASFHGRWHAALVLGKELLTLLESPAGTGHTHDLWRRMLEVASAAHHAGENGELSCALHEKILDMIPRNRPNDRVGVLQHFAEVVYYQGDPERAEQCMAEALELTETNQSVEESVWVRSQCARFQVMRGDLTGAERNFDAAYDQWERDVRPGKSTIEACAQEEVMCRDYGWLYIAQGRYRNARLSFEKGLVLSQQMKRDEPEADNFRGLAIIALEQGKLTQARDLLESGFVIWRNKGHKHWQSLFLLAFAEIAIRSGDDIVAERLCSNAEEHTSITKSQGALGAALYCRGRLAIRQIDLREGNQEALPQTHVETNPDAYSSSRDRDDHSANDGNRDGAGIPTAVALLQQSLRLRMRFANRNAALRSLAGIAEALIATACTTEGRDNKERAAKGASLLAAVGKARHESGMPYSPIDALDVARIASEARRILGATEWDRVSDEGTALGFDDAVRLALGS